MSSNYLPTSYQEFIHLSRYSRWLPEEKRRETWKELVERNKQMHIKKYPELKSQIDKAYKMVLDKKV